MQKGTLHLIPNILSENSTEAIPAYIKDIVTRIKIFYVEEIRSARRFLKMMNKEIIIDDLTFYMLNEHENDSLQLASNILKKGNDIGYISEAGCPSVADPGQELVAIAHATDCIVKPYVGPNSILLALMASGYNGQHFQFHGYLPNKQPMLSKKIYDIESESKLKNCTQIFIETPYRNNQLLAELIKSCTNQTRLCIATDLTGKNEKVVSKTIGEWKNMDISFHKIPAVFVLYAGII